MAAVELLRLLPLLFPVDVAGGLEAGNSLGINVTNLAGIWYLGTCPEASSENYMKTKTPERQNKSQYLEEQTNFKTENCKHIPHG